VKLQQVPRPNHLDHLSDDARGYPIISTVGRDEDGADFGSINERRKLALATFDWCAVCGLPFGKALRWQVVPGSATALDDDQLEEELFFNEAPVREVCIVYAAHVCPHLSSPGHRMGDRYRAGQRREDKIRMAGFGRTSKVRAFGSGLQKGTHVLHLGQAGFVDEFSYSRPDELADRYAALLASEEVPELSPPESALVSLFNEHGDMGGTVVGAALMAGASFAKDIKKAQGMQVFAKSGYWQGLAVHMLDPEKLAEFGEALRTGLVNSWQDGTWSTSGISPRFWSGGVRLDRDWRGQGALLSLPADPKAVAGPSRRTPRARAAPGVRHDVVIRLAYLRLGSSPLAALDAYMSRVSPELLEQLRRRTHLTDLPGSRRQGRPDEGASSVALARQPQLMLQLRQRLGVKQLPAAPQPAVGGEPRTFAGLSAANGPVREGHLKPGELGRRSTAHDSLPPSGMTGRTHSGSSSSEAHTSACSGRSPS
jgi:hypothetical protein